MKLIFFILIVKVLGVFCLQCPFPGASINSRRDLANVTVRYLWPGERVQFDCSKTNEVYDKLTGEMTCEDNGTWGKHVYNRMLRVNEVGLYTKGTVGEVSCNTSASRFYVKVNLTNIEDFNISISTCKGDKISNVSHGYRYGSKDKENATLCKRKADNGNSFQCKRHSKRHVLERIYIDFENEGSLNRSGIKVSVEGNDGWPMVPINTETRGFVTYSSSFFPYKCTYKTLTQTVEQSKEFPTTVKPPRTGWPSYFDKPVIIFYLQPYHTTQRSVSPTEKGVLESEEKPETVTVYMEDTK